MPVSGLVVSQIEDVTVVSFRSNSIIDAATVEAIAQELYALVDKQARRKLVLDFEQVRFLSSQMLGTLVALQKKIKTIKGRYVIAGLRPELYKVFKITSLNKILEFADTEGEALGLLGAR